MRGVLEAPTTSRRELLEELRDALNVQEAIEADHNTGPLAVATVDEHLDSLDLDDAGKSTSEPGSPSDMHNDFPEWARPFEDVLERCPTTSSAQERSNELSEALAQVHTRTRRAIFIVGAHGTGRSTFLQALAHRLAETEQTCVLVRADLEHKNADRLARALAVAPPSACVVIDDMDDLTWLDTESPARLALSLAHSVRTTRASIVCTLRPRSIGRLAILAPQFVDDSAVITLESLPIGSVERVVAAELPALARHHGVEASQELIDAAIKPRRGHEPTHHPGLALERLDAALARAKVDGRGEASVADLSRAGDHTPVHVARADLETALGERIKGQPHAISAIAKRLTLTRTGLDLRPERPNGVFLFVGPTGVGKTELAHQLARHEYGDLDHLIRLDMSEYSKDWAVSRLVGPMPGYVGSTEPESWLTTRVAKLPRCVILLDEIEKAHPGVWNIFLQVFDAGRLTDSRGTTADFRDTVMILTSNLGAREASRNAVGFGEDTGDPLRRMRNALDTHMPPEFLNRIDEIVLFQHLGMEEIVRIAQSELDSLQERLISNGWYIRIAPEVSTWLAETGYNPDFGARHLQRNIERELLAQLAEAQSKTVTVTVRDGGLRMDPA
ncbi:AAA family ATPase [Serinibacter salmoneus]|uniref:AAA family ATPase n=1 Tax=Serinibacter salmoneus TaxID=556530 RepID=UPI000BF304DD|nr:AAA family ATPase [Serinibacter salmoneus]